MVCQTGFGASFGHHLSIPYKQQKIRCDAQDAQIRHRNSSVLAKAWDGQIIHRECPINAQRILRMPKWCPKSPTGILPLILASTRLAWSRVCCSKLTKSTTTNKLTMSTMLTPPTTILTPTTSTTPRRREKGVVSFLFQKSGGDEEPCILEVVTMSYMLVKVVGETEEEIFFPSEMRLLWGQYIALRGWFCTERWNGLCINTLYKTNNQVARDSIHNVYGIFNLFSKFAKEMKKRVSW